MKIAIVHDRIINIWWAEKVLFKELNKIKWEIKIFTSFYKKQNSIYNVDYIFEVKNNKIFWLDYRNYMPFFPLIQKRLTNKIKKRNPDKVYIYSFAIAKNIDIEADLIYLHSPMQYIRDMYDEYLEKLSWFKKIFFKKIANYLRKRDKKYTHNKAIKYSNSYYTKYLAKKIYWWETEVKYPEIDEIFYNKKSTKKLDYFVYIWRIVKFSKELDKIIDLFNETWENLIIIWDWPDKNELKKRANQNILFVDYIEDKETLADILSKSRWLINLTKESFWLTTAEAIATWVPVLAYWKWASFELLTWIKNDNEYENLEKYGKILKTDKWVLIFNKDKNTILEGFNIFKKYA